LSAEEEKKLEDAMIKEKRKKEALKRYVIGSGRNWRML
jgi:hypothetical protein